jgi:uncharacterized membrane protein YqhA
MLPVAMIRAFGTIALFLYVIGFLVSFCIGLVISGLGIWKISKSLLGPEQQIVVEALAGIEYLLLAPLIIAVTVGIARYVEAILPEYSGKRDPQEQIHNLKIPITSVMISVLSTELLKRFVNGQLDYQSFVCGRGMIILLIGYLLSLNYLRN